MNPIRQYALYLLAILFVSAGINHFVNPAFYLRMMPPYLPWPEVLQKMAGAAEILGGLGLLYPPLRPYAAWGLIALLVAVFPANLYMYQARDTVFASFPQWALLLRLPLQALMIWWVYLYT